MAVLLLAYGDPQAKQLLRQAIEARYGVRPPALESLQIDFKGRTKTKVGPVSTWVPVDVTAYFHFPNAMRWDFVVKPLGLPVQRGVESLYESVYRVMRNKAPSIVTETAQIAYLRRRLWAIAAMLLTPLGEDFVKLGINPEPYSFYAVNTRIDDQINLVLRPNYTLEKVYFECENPDTERIQRFEMRLAEPLIELEELAIPSKITVCWDDEPYFEIEPSAVISNPTLETSVFSLEVATI